MTDRHDDLSTLLIVDDEAHVRSALRRTLRKEGHRLVFASSGVEAMEKMREERPDVVLSDHLMPEMTGLELLKKCCLLYPHTGRILLTGQAELETVIRAINDGAIFRVLQKPWDDDELKLTIHLAFQRVGVERENARLRHQVDAQARRIVALERALAARSDDRRDGAIIISEEELAALP